MRRLFRFDEPPAEYELLETESGEPSFFGGWRMQDPAEPGGQAREHATLFVSNSLDDNLEHLQQEYRSDINKDIIMRRFSMGGQVRAAVVFFDGMANANQINDFILKPAMRQDAMRGATQPPARHAVEHVIAMQDATVIQDWGEVKTAIGDGRCVVFFDGDDHVVVMDTRGFPGRNVTEPKNETVILGPHEAFTENIRVNISLLRKIIKTDDFVCEFRPSGGRNNVRIAIAYREGTANPALSTRSSDGWPRWIRLRCCPLRRSSS